MKINKKILIFIALLLIILLSIILVIKITTKKETKECDIVDLNEIVIDVNAATNVEYRILDNEQILLEFSIPFDEKNNLVFAKDYEKEDNYFMIVEDLSSDKIEEIKKYVKFEKSMDKEVIFDNYGKYSYLISSKEYTSTILGIIRSYIYCEKEA